MCIDTIPGRQCMASCFFLLKQFEDVLIYLNSVKVWSIKYTDPTYHAFIWKLCLIWSLLLCNIISLARNYGEDDPLVICVTGQKRKLFIHRHPTLRFLSFVSMLTPYHQMIMETHHIITCIMVISMNISVSIGVWLTWDQVSSPRVEEPPSWNSPSNPADGALNNRMHPLHSSMNVPANYSRAVPVMSQNMFHIYVGWILIHSCSKWTM